MLISVANYNLFFTNFLLLQVHTSVSISTLNLLHILFFLTILPPLHPYPLPITSLSLQTMRLLCIVTAIET
ncbi:hypothetical protein F4804DRAFT_325313 [Jackrogersella minutella]|nr:hypothetical protein F4804DRAFT_325313 [Jackrogersella minutella]